MPVVKSRVRRHGDTIVEVMFAITVFAVVAILAINMMNSGINTAQRTLEVSMARNEIDAQAEALRYIHQSYVAERQLSKEESQYRRLWNALREAATRAQSLKWSAQPGVITTFDINSYDSCEKVYQGIVNGDGSSSSSVAYNSFVLNTRLLLPDSEATYNGSNYDTNLNNIIVGAVNVEQSGGTMPTGRLRPTSLYPRIIYGSTLANTGSSNLKEDQIYDQIYYAEGIWITAAGDNNDAPSRSNYYDFYIRTCWEAAGDNYPSTITTIVRLYNPEVIE